MSSYLTPINYLLWVLFIGIEIFLFFKLTTLWLKPVKYFMLYAVIRDALLLGLTSKTLLYEYFTTYWIGQMVSLIWFAYISGCIVKKLLPNTSKLIYFFPATIVSILCSFNLPPKHTALLYSMQLHCSLISILSITTAVLIKLNKQYSKPVLATAGIIGSVVITSLAWFYLGYQPLLWEAIWIVALIGVVLAANSPEQQTLALEPLSPASAA